MSTAMLNVYPHLEFNEMMKFHGWMSKDDIPDDAAYISICNTNDEMYPEEKRTHWFKEDCVQIINVDFDDVSSEEDESGYAIDYTQAEMLVKFIVENYGRDFYIHCSAGKSRSQSIARFILDCGKEISMYKNCEEVLYKERPENPCLTPNWLVVSMLKNEWRNYKW